MLMSCGWESLILVQLLLFVILLLLVYRSFVCCFLCNVSPDLACVFTEFIFLEKFGFVSSSLNDTVNNLFFCFEASVKKADDLK